ncbi:hypothetical protein ACFSTC_34725 [Nonomuraea ferruginea]
MYEGNPTTVLFALQAKAADGAAAPDEGGGSAFWQRAAQLTFEGFNLGLIIALAALGLSLIYGTTGLTNFAHGELVTLGGLARLSCERSLRPAHRPGRGHRGHAG